MHKDELQATEALAQMGVTPHITHLIQEERCFYSVITVASPKYTTYVDLQNVLTTIYLEGAITHTHGSDLDRLLIERFAGVGCGVSPCHQQDQFDRTLGRTIAKGRLLKYYRAYLLKPYKQSMEVQKNV